MRRTKRTEVRVEIDEVLIVKRRGGAVLTWCAECAAEVAMVTPDEAAAVALTSTRAIYALVEAGRLHWSETPERQLLICAVSLLANLT